MVANQSIEQAISSLFPESVMETEEVNSVRALYVRGEEITGLCASLKESPDFKFDYLTSLTAVDWPDRFDVVYHLYSIPLKHCTTLKVKVNKDQPTVPSVTSVWQAANWQEREVYDMFGIKFEGHPDLHRILLEPDWEGFPLRKDYVEK